MVPPDSLVIAEIRYRMIELVVPAGSTRLDIWTAVNTVGGTHVVSLTPQWSNCFNHRIFWLPSPGSLNSWVSRHCSTRRHEPLPFATWVVTVDSFLVVKNVGAYFPGQLVPEQIWSTGTSGQLLAFAVVSVQVAP